MTRKNLLLSGVGALLMGSARAQEKPAPEKPVLEQVPELIGAPKDWINGKPVKLGDLKGKVIVAFYWTFQ
ncbi:hypothetical protein [Armatimonas sp.]|uniref:hypothetical protein n=1 Tax=Armatimonas sp. TaxID=1872638 RepID=UPI00286A5BA9|nr:hypothetical protein [Armatimonas sp.]